MKLIILILFTFLFLQLAWGQITFSDKQLYEIVLKNHPLARQANLQPKFGEAEILGARGAFDPKAYTYSFQKNFNSEAYYNLLNLGLKVPTWYGVEVKSGFESNRGLYIDPQDKTPNSGLFYAGASLNLGKGLLIDQRRAELFKAKVYNESTQFEQKLQLNELIYESGYAYWNWFLSYHSMQIFNEAYLLAIERFNAVKRTEELGDRPEIDVVEAGLQVQNRESMLQNFKADYFGSGYNLATYLWNDQVLPLELDSLTLPLKIDSVQNEIKPILSNQVIDSFVLHHPYLQITNFKIKSLEIEKKLKREQLKPELNIQYNFLNQLKIYL